MDRKVTVCANCLRASCWEGVFMCDGARTAGLVEKSVGQLRRLNLEHSSYYSKAHIDKYTNPVGYRSNVPGYR